MVSDYYLQSFKTDMMSSNKEFYKFKCLSLSELRDCRMTGCNVIYEKLGKHCFRNRSFNTKHRLPSTVSLPDYVTSPYLVVMLGELNVGKSALCRNFFRSGLTITRKNSTVCHSIEDCADELFEDSTSSYAQHHYLFERPIFVNGVGNRVRILDVNSEKQLLESDAVDGVGDVSQYLHVGDGCIVAYTCTDRSTFETAKKLLNKITQMQKYTNRSFPIILVGNKCDLVRNRQISTSDGIKLAEKFNVKFIETSAVLSENIEQLFQGMVEQIRLQRSAEEAECSLRKGDFYGSTNSLLLEHKEFGKSLATKCWRKFNLRKQNKVKRCLNFAVL